MKIICKDNFDRDTVSDIIIAKDLTSYYAKRIAEALNDQEGEYSADFYVAVPDDYIIYTYIP